MKLWKITKKIIKKKKKTCLSMVTQKINRNNFKTYDENKIKYKKELSLIPLKPKEITLWKSSFKQIKEINKKESRWTMIFIPS